MVSMMMTIGSSVPAVPRAAAPTPVVGPKPVAVVVVAAHPAAVPNPVVVEAYPAAGPIQAAVADPRPA
jgi:hypothetical protein